jgi:hypothetical protein
MIKHLFPVFILQFIVPLTSFAFDENDVIYDKTYDDSIKTVMLYNSYSNLSYPIIRLNNGEQLILEFDDLSGQIENYYYTFVHCDMDWMPTRMNKNEYLDGFFENSIDQYQSSINTTVGYIHYSSAFPNESIHFKISGNYIVMVYKEGDSNKPILTRRFFVVEPLVGIDVRVLMPPPGEQQKTMQEIQFAVDYSQYPVMIPGEELKVFVFQNYRWDNPMRYITPSFIRNNFIEYGSSGNILFEGGRDFEELDFVSLKYNAPSVQSTEYIFPYYYVTLKHDVLNYYGPYFKYDDIDGKRMIRAEKYNDPEVSADYAWVTFSVPQEVPFIDGQIYIMGALSDFQLEDDYKMIYNFDKKAYEVTALLKQGYYNYQYVFVQNTDPQIGSANYLSGGFFETQNTYLIFVYHDNPSVSYHRLVGVNIINSAGGL